MPDNRFLSFLKKERGLWKIALLFAVGLCFLLFGKSGGGGKSTEPDTLETYRKTLEGEVADLCSDVKSVGKCKVMITFECGEVTKYQSGKAIGTEPPRVYAVAVICDGGGKAEVREKLVPLLSALFGIGANRITVLPLG